MSDTNGVRGDLQVKQNSEAPEQTKNNPEHHNYKMTNETTSVISMNVNRLELISWNLLVINLY